MAVGAAVAGVGIVACLAKVICAAGGVAAAVATGAAIGAGVGAGSYTVGGAVGNIASGKEWNAGLSVGGGITAAANGAVAGAIGGGVFSGLGALAGVEAASLTMTSGTTWGYATLAGPAASLGSIGFKLLTGQHLGGSDGAGAAVSWIPLPQDLKLQIMVGMFIDQMASAIGGALR
jgi:trimeric autotransporter adhesin